MILIQGSFANYLSLIFGVYFLAFSNLTFANLAAPAQSYDGTILLSWSFPTNSSVKLYEKLNGTSTYLGQFDSSSSTSLTSRATGTYTYTAVLCTYGNTGAMTCGPTSSSSVVQVFRGVPASAPQLTLPASSNTGDYVLQWQPVSGANEYRWQRKANGGSWSAEVSAGSLISRSFSDAGGTYAYRVKACNPNGCSGFSAERTITVVFPELNMGDTGFLPDLSRGEFVGITRGAADVSGGAALYSVPIQLPPAIRDLKPLISLSYTSRSNTSLAGFGWNLTGFSSISRCPKSFQSDGASAQKSNPRYSNADRLCLDNKKLQLVNTPSATDSDYWAAGAEYRTQIDSFVKITASGSHQGGPEEFIVKDKSGLTYYYGREDIGQNSRIYAVGRSNGPVAQWLLSKVVDLYGNAYSVHYHRDTATGEYYPAHALFGPGSAVEFHYDARDEDAAGDASDVASGFDTGYPFRVSKILTGISTYSNVTGGTPSSGTRVMEYVLTHRRGAITGRYLLETLSECGFNASGNRQCARPLIFEWQTGEIGFSETRTNLRDCAGNKLEGVGGQALVHDINQDGYNDVYGKAYFSTAAGCLQKVSVSATATSAINQPVQTRAGVGVLTQTEVKNSGDVPKIYLTTYAGGVEKIVQITEGPAYTGGYNKSKMIVGDFNNDGLEDFYFHNYLWLQNNTTAGGFTRQASSGFIFDYGAYIATDTNSDGLLDIVGRDIFINNGNGTFSSLGNRYAPGWVAGVGDRDFGDFNGDGLLDWSYNLNTGAGAVALVGGEGSYTLDYNKDGKTDVVYRKVVGGSPPVQVHVSLARSDGGKITFVSYGPAFYDYVDGLASLDFTAANQFDPNYSQWDHNRNFFKSTNLLPGDMNNDGLVDFVFGSAAFAKRPQPDLLSKVTDGFGAEIRFEYDPLHSEDHQGKPLYTPTPSSGFPVVQGNRAMQVVKTLSSSDGMGGWNYTDYHYFGAKNHLQGLGFLGFEKIQITDRTLGTARISEYRQDFPYIGFTKRVETKDGGGRLISLVQNEYSLHSQNSRFPYLRASVTRNYALTGSDVNSDVGASKVNYTYDQYGNLTEQDSITGYGYSSNRVTMPISRSKAVYAYTNDLSNYRIGFRNRSEISAWTYTNGLEDPASLKQSVTTYEAEPGKLDIKIVTQFLGTEIERTDTSIRNLQGVVTETRSVGKDIDNLQTTARQSTLSNFLLGIFPREVRNSLGHRAILSYDTRFGAVRSTTDPNGLVSSVTYDELGRSTQQVAADGTVTELKSFYCETAPVNCPEGGVYASATVITHPNAANTYGAPVTVQYFDALQRVIREEVYNVNGDVVKVDTQYYPDGRLYRVSEPFTGWSADYWTTYENYDALNRPGVVTGPDGGAVETVYARDGNQLRTTQTTLVVSPNGYSEQVSTSWRNALGQVSRVEDDLSTAVVYTYDSLGNLATTRVNNDSRTDVIISSNSAGLKTRLTDPATGTIGYEYNAFGELRRQTWAPGTANAKSITYTYDTLGRQTNRTDKTATGSATAYSWLWDTIKLGELTHSTGNGYQEIYGYDTLSRVNRVDTKIDSNTWTTNQTYDAYSRPKTTTYPNGFKADRRYHAAGLHMQTYNVTTSTPSLLWEQQYDSDARGQLVRSKFGNGVMTQVELDQLTGRLNRIVTGKLSSTNTANRLFGDVQNLSYKFDSLGNLAERRSERTNASGAPQEGLLEALHYDTLNRLEIGITSGLSLTDRRVDYAYDLLGNLTNRSDKGVLQYARTNNASIYGITSGAGKNYQYDLYGNVTSRGSDTVTYDVFNKPTKIGSTTFAYGPEHQRFKQVNGSKVTYYVGGDFEEIRDGTSITQKAYVDGLLIYSKTGTTGKIHYLHYDHLGSVESITDEAGAVVSRMSFNPWGERQLSDWKTGTPSNLSTLPTTRGYTSHEHLDHLGLIHMGGRVYDPGVGRFLSADLIVNDPYESQSYNRYSYVRNHPLSATDPSGYRECNCGWDMPMSDQGKIDGGSTTVTGYSGLTGADAQQYMNYLYGMGYMGSSNFNGQVVYNFNVEGVKVGVFERNGQWFGQTENSRRQHNIGFDEGLNELGRDIAKRNGRGLSLFFSSGLNSSDGQMGRSRSGGSGNSSDGMTVLAYMLISFDVANTFTGIGAGPDTGIMGMAILASKTAAKASKRSHYVKAQLPTKGKIRYVPPKKWHPDNPLPRGQRGGYMDKFGNEWTKGPSRTKGEPFEWDVQRPDGSHWNISLEGKVTH